MAKLPTRPMGKQGMEVGMQGYGCMGLTAFYGNPVEDDVGIAVMQKAFDLGVTYFDTAEIYTVKVGEKTLYNEELVGKFANKVGRDKVQIGTKFFPSPQKASCSARVVRDSVEASLKRLGTNYIDLYYLHRVPSEEGVLENFMECMKSLVEEGKIKYVGLSEATPAEIRRAHAIHPLTCVQQEWSMMVRSLEAEVVPTCRELGIAIVAYSPLARGFASAKVKKADDWNKIGNGGADGQKFQEIAVPYMSGDNLEKNAALLAPVEVLAEKEKVSPSQVSLAWVQANGVDVFPIPGTTKISNLESNIAAAHLSLKLDKAVFDQLGKDVDVSKISGTRYVAAMMGLTVEGKSGTAGLEKPKFIGTGPHNTRFQQTMLRIKDPKKSVEFYCKNFGFTLVHWIRFDQYNFSIYFLERLRDDAPVKPPPCTMEKTSKENEYYTWHMSGATLELTHNHGSETDDSFKVWSGNTGKDGTGADYAETPAFRGFVQIGMACDDVDTSFAKLKANGVVAAKEPISFGNSGAKLASVLDPDGYKILITTRSIKGAFKEEWNLTQTALRVKDGPASAAFYEKHFGMSVIFKLELPNLTEYFMSTATKEELAESETKGYFNQCINLLWNHGTEKNPDYKPHDGNTDPKGFGHIGFLIDDLEASCVLMEANGASFKKRPNEGAMRGLAFVYDPDGYSIELVDRNVTFSGIASNY